MSRSYWLHFKEKGGGLSDLPKLLNEIPGTQCNASDMPILTLLSDNTIIHSNIAITMIAKIMIVFPTASDGASYREAAQEILSE